MFESIRKVILPANDMRNLQVDIVRARRQMVCRHAIAAQQRKVFHVGRKLRLRAKHFIFKRNFLRRVPLHAVTITNGSPAAARRSLSSFDSARISGLQSHGPSLCGRSCVSVSVAGTKSR